MGMDSTLEKPKFKCPLALTTCVNTGKLRIFSRPRFSDLGWI